MGIAGEEPDRFEYTPGKSIVAACGDTEIIVGNRLFLEGHRIAIRTDTGSRADSEIFVAREGKFLGTLVVADRLRPEATKAIQDLKSMGLKTVLLTGDSKAVANDIGRKLGVDEIAAELLPEDKLEFVSRLTEARHNVVMVGDGVNVSESCAGCIYPRFVGNDFYSELRPAPSTSLFVSWSSARTIFPLFRSDARLDEKLCRLTRAIH